MFKQKNAQLNVHIFQKSAQWSAQIKDNYTFEVGGKQKGDQQIESITKGKGFIVKDDTEYVYMNHIPLWMFGFLY